MSETIDIALNGERRTVPAGSTIADLVALLGLPTERVAVEHNREVIRRAEWPATRLDDGDRVEVVHFVGGG